MRELEAIDQKDRQDGTEHLSRLRQVPPETGRFLAILASLAPRGPWVEIGTSAGYSALWFSLAAREVGAHMSTYEVLPEKIEQARKTIELAGIGDVVESHEGDGLEGVQSLRQIAFCFLDADKDRAVAFYSAIVPRLVPGGLFVVDNAISHKDRLGEMLELTIADPRLDSVVVPIGKGVLVCRRSLEVEPRKFEG